MSAKSAKQLDNPQSSTQEDDSVAEALRVKVMSFGYKQGSVPNANVVFDVRFLKNPYWVEELRPLTGLDRAVQDYVMEQPLARDFLDSIVALFDKILPQLEELKINEFIIALGCTGGQHRSATLVEALSRELCDKHPHYHIVTEHRELNHKRGEEKRVQSQ